MRTLLFLIILIGCTAACKKLETVPPVVTLFSPMANDSFYTADSVSLSFNIKDKSLRSYSVIISNSYTRKIYYKEQMAISTNDTSIDKKVFVSVPNDTIAYINVLAVDANGNTGGAGTSFKLKR